MSAFSVRCVLISWCRFWLVVSPCSESSGPRRSNRDAWEADTAKRHRHRKMNGMAAWRFDVTMESLPAMLQIVPLASCYELSRSLWNVNQTIAAVTIATPSLGFLFYVSIVSSFGYLFIVTFSKMGGIGDELAYSGRSGAAAGSAS